MVKPKTALKYITEGDGQEIDMMIQFETQCADCLFSDYMPTKFSLRKLKKAFSTWQRKLSGKGWNMLYMENHDHPRIISRYGSEKFWRESGKMLATAYLFQQGTPFVYQGQEIGMLNWRPESPDMYEDVQTIWQYEHKAVRKPAQKRLERLWRASRDSARTPVQWDSSENAGFTTGEPWFHVNPNYTEINVAQQESDEDSILNFYRRAIALRRSLECVRSGAYREHFKLSAKLYCYTRELKGEKILVLCSFSDKEQKLRVPALFRLKKAELVLCNYSEASAKTLRPYECRVYLIRK